MQQVRKINRGGGLGGTGGFRKGKREGDRWGPPNQKKKEGGECEHARRTGGGNTKQSIHTNKRGEKEIEIGGPAGFH